MVKSKFGVKRHVKKSKQEKKSVTALSDSGKKSRISRLFQDESSAGSPKTERLSTLQQTFKKKLEGARFRYINEQLYTSKGVEAFGIFQADPTLFDVVINRQKFADFPIMTIISFSTMKASESKSSPGLKILLVK